MNIFRSYLKEAVPQKRTAFLRGMREKPADCKGFVCSIT